MSTILVHPVTKGLYEALTDDQAEAFALRGWKPLDESSGVTKDELVAQAKAAGRVVDPKATKAEIAAELVTAEPVADGDKEG